MAEVQYERCFEVERVVLGSMSSQRWRDDARSLLFTLSRYKQVARLLGGKGRVAEIGCGDGFAGRLVEEVVGRLDRYDFDVRFCGESGAGWYDVTAGVLPARYDAIFALDVLEHIWEVDTALRNICCALEDDGVLVVGMPSLQSQVYASPLSKAGHVSCMTGDELKIVMGGYFKNVFVFSMSDEVMHTGYYPMAHYLLSVGCGVRRCG